jgi:pimeloyl-ACP methyl ester carboxylesterase
MMSSEVQESDGLTEENLVFVPGLYSRWVVLANGAKAHYVTAGETGPAVILCHGGIDGSSGTAGFRHMAPFLGANGFRVFCPDQPGFGLADTSRPEYMWKSYKEHSDFIKMFADALCLDKFHIAGNSMGCVTSLNTLLAHPDRILSVAFIAGTMGDLVDARVGPTEGRFSPRRDAPIDVLGGFDGSDESMRVLLESINHFPNHDLPGTYNHAGKSSDVAERGSRTLGRAAAALHRA